MNGSGPEPDPLSVEAAGDALGDAGSVAVGDGVVEKAGYTASHATSH